MWARGEGKVFKHVKSNNLFVIFIDDIDHTTSFLKLLFSILHVVSFCFPNSGLWIHSSFVFLSSSTFDENSQTFLNLLNLLNLLKLLISIMNSLFSKFVRFSSSSPLFLCSFLKIISYCYLRDGEQRKNKETLLYILLGIFLELEVKKKDFIKFPLFFLSVPSPHPSYQIFHTAFSPSTIFLLILYKFLTHFAIIHSIHIAHTLSQL